MTENRERLKEMLQAAGSVNDLLFDINALLNGAYGAFESDEIGCDSARLVWMAQKQVKAALDIFDPIL